MSDNAEQLKVTLTALLHDAGIDGEITVFVDRTGEYIVTFVRADGVRSGVSAGGRITPKRSVEDLVAHCALCIGSYFQAQRA